MNDIRRIAEFVRDLADLGYSSEDIARELENAADEAEFGWIGSKHFGTTAGPVPLSEDALTLGAVEELTDTTRKTIKTDDLRIVLGHEL